MNWKWERRGGDRKKWREPHEGVSGKCHRDSIKAVQQQSKANKLSQKQAFFTSSQTFYNCNSEEAWNKLKKGVFFATHTQKKQKQYQS